MSDSPSGAIGTEPPEGPVQLEIAYFTDPLCCWSWGFEPQLRRLRYAYAGRLAWRLRMGGMIPGWEGFQDPVNAIYRPAQMAPLWLQAKHTTGMPVDAALWLHDPPSSSWPSCVAVKAAELQSGVAADLYLRRLREAAMAEGRNIAKRDILLELADGLGRTVPSLFDAESFRAAFDGATARKAFEDDVREARFRGVGRFPSLVLHRPGRAVKILVGWRPYPVLQAELTDLVPELGPERKLSDPASYRAYWDRLTERELEVAIRDERGTDRAFHSGDGLTTSGHTRI